jgi:hypothetical protein
MLRCIFEADQISIPDDPLLISQLSGQRFKFTSAGKIQIVDAEGKSPDYADSAMLIIDIDHTPGVASLEW